MGNITTHVATDGTVYLHTHHGESAAEIAEALKPYVGRFMGADIPNMYGHCKTYHARLDGIDGNTVHLYVPRLGQTATVDAFTAFGSHCAIIDKEAP